MSVSEGRMIGLTFKPCFIQPPRRIMIVSGLTPASYSNFTAKTARTGGQIDRKILP